MEKTILVNTSSNRAIENSSLHTDTIVHATPPQLEQLQERIQEEGTVTKRSEPELKQRKSRTNYSPRQVELLEFAYSEHAKYPPVQVREILANSMDLKEAQVRVWFQNRRAKDKRNSTAPSLPTVARNMGPLVGTTASMPVSTGHVNFTTAQVMFPNVPQMMQSCPPSSNRITPGPTSAGVGAKQWSQMAQQQQSSLTRPSEIMMSSNPNSGYPGGSVIAPSQAAAPPTTHTGQYPPNVNLFHPVKQEFNSASPTNPMPPRQFFGPSFGPPSYWHPFLQTSQAQPGFNMMYNNNYNLPRGQHPQGTQFFSSNPNETVNIPDDANLEFHQPQMASNPNFINDSNQTMFQNCPTVTVASQPQATTEAASANDLGGVKGLGVSQF